MSDENQNETTTTENQNETTEDPALAALAEAKRITGNRQWPVIVTLGTPVQFGKETIVELTFQKGNLGVLNGLGVRNIEDVPTADELMTIAARLSGRPLKVIHLIDPDDANEVINIALGFWARCRGAGKRLSAS